MAANEHITNIVLDAAMMPEMTAREKALRDLFVKEYLEDYDPFAACLRCGFMRSFAAEYATKFMGEPYVRQQLQIMQHVETNIAPSEDEYNKKRIMNGLFREANFRGEGSSHSARVAALAKLAALHGMEPKGTGPADANVHRGGVMSVPAIASLDAWEETAVASQERLVHNART